MIVDTHFHIYNPFRAEGALWPDPENVLLYRPTLPVHVKAQAVPEGVEGVVVVEASEWVEDNQCILEIAKDEPFIVGLVGRLEPGDENFAADLERFAAKGAEKFFWRNSQRQYCGHFFDFERIFVRLKFVSDYLSTSYKFQYLFA